ncbi:MAG: hypothetical protein CM1200mP26_18200 [Acidimicrobiales bacterium]|nr:MAG: hypothetical protein CM1200mP26_18200 [Acidimicrobiales bacterium]
MGVWSGFPDKWPTAYAAVQKMNFTNLDIAQLAMYVDIDGMEPEDAANKWLADNCGRWTGWTGADSSACPEAPGFLLRILWIRSSCRSTTGPARSPALRRWRHAGVHRQLGRVHLG